MSRPLAWLAAALLCTGCALATATLPPVEVAAVRLRGLGLLDQTLGVTLCVTNPNNSELAFWRIQVAVDAAGSLLAEGASETPVRLPPRSSILMPFTVVSTMRNLVPQLFSVLSAGAVEYRLHGSIMLETQGVTVPFSRSGRFGLSPAAAHFYEDRILPQPGPERKSDKGMACRPGRSGQPCAPIEIHHATTRASMPQPKSPPEQLWDFIRR